MLIELQHLSKSYPLGGRHHRALHDVDLRIGRGELVMVVGKSGSGKSTLLNMIAGLDRPTGGRVRVCDVTLDDLDEDGLARFRGRHVGIVFQFFQLLPTLTVLENVMLAMDLVGRVPSTRRRKTALDLLQRVDVADQCDKLPTTLSGGQQQRVAIARALANDPPIVVADEPTGNLDSQTARDVMRLFSELRDAGKTVLVVTHDANPGLEPTRVVTIRDGEVA